MTIRTALIGFGTAGRVFHAPFLHGDPEYSLDVVVTGSPERVAEAGERYPQARIVPRPHDVFDLAGSLDLVVVGSPPATHVPLARRSIDAGLAVVVDKPLAVTASEGESLVEHADRRGVALTVFQNRRWDGDFLTLRSLVDKGHLGDVRRFESRFEWWKPVEIKAWKAESTPSQGGGVLFDLGAHLIDQAIQLFGPVESVQAELSTHRSGGGAEDDAFVSILHRSGVRSHLSMNAMAAQVGPRFHLLGSRAAYTKWGLDPQEAALKAGALPTDPEFAREPESCWGRLGVDGSLRRVPTLHGSYATFYRRLADALLRGGPLPVDPADAVAVVSIIESIHRDFPVATQDA